MDRQRKQYLSCGIQNAHDGRLMYDIYNYAHIRFDDLGPDFINVCKARPTCLRSH